MTPRTHAFFVRQPYQQHYRCTTCGERADDNWRDQSKHRDLVRLPDNATAQEVENR